MITKNCLKPDVTYRTRGHKMIADTTKLVGLLALLTGCGGGGGSISTPIPTPIPTVAPVPVVSPTPSPILTVPAKDRAIAANFSPNYIPADSKRYLRWADHKSLRVFIHPSVNNVVDKTPVGNIDSARAQSAVREALDFWTVASTADVQFSLVESVDTADIQIYLVDELRRLDGSAAPGVGLANYSFTFPNSDDSTHGLLDSAVVQILASQPAVNLTDTIAHEVGHALGIETHSEDSNDLLFATSLPPTTITQRDQNTMFFLYYSPTAVGGRATATSPQNNSIYTDEIICPAN